MKDDHLLTDETINRIGLGTWQLAGEYFNNGHHAGYGSINDRDALHLLRSAFESGINFYDSSELYGHGRAETLLGKAFGPNSPVQICSKFGYFLQGETIVRDFSAGRIDSAIHNSLMRLNREYLDYYLLHNPRPDEITDDLLEKLTALKSSGKIGKIGISVTFLKDYSDFFNFFDAFEIVYNEITPDNIPFLSRLKGKEVFARSVFASGLLLKDEEILLKIQLKDWRKDLNPKIYRKAIDYRKMNPGETAKDLIQKALLQSFDKVIIGCSSKAQLNALRTWL